MTDDADHPPTLLDEPVDRLGEERRTAREGSVKTTRISPSRPAAGPSSESSSRTWPK